MIDVAPLLPGGIGGGGGGAECLNLFKQNLTTDSG